MVFVTESGEKGIFIQSKEGLNAKLVWEKKVKVVEVTIDQIAEKFGVKPEQIKVKK